MARQANPNALDLVLRAVRGIVTFRGRSRRSELVYYWIAAMLMSTMFGLIPHQLPIRTSWILDQATQLLVFMPIFAQFARRLHDANLSGWWALLLPPTMVLGIYSSARFVFRDIQTGASTLADLPLWASLFQIGGVLFALAVVLVVPGTDGPNRYGPDPRRSIDPEQLRAGDQQDEAEGAQDPLWR
ncbi:MAG: hypothetical protein B7Z07_00345 [Sphingomonadales bacterium 32-67-7]|nr:MAG: hypothetical protein B7Z07_00345 [Sphingomonadales bacterium 32-67-7]